MSGEDEKTSTIDSLKESDDTHNDGLVDETVDQVSWKSMRRRRTSIDDKYDHHHNDDTDDDPDKVD